MDKRLIPYSVHLPEPVFNKIKQFAGERKAASLVREAIVSFVENQDLFNRGYASGIEAAIKKIKANKHASSVAINGQAISESLAQELQQLIK